MTSLPKTKTPSEGSLPASSSYIKPDYVSASSRDTQLLLKDQIRQDLECVRINASQLTALLDSYAYQYNSDATDPSVGSLTGRPSIST